MKFLVLVIFSFFMCTSFAQQSAEKVIKTVSVPVIKEELNKHEFINLDVRTP